MPEHSIIASDEDKAAAASSTIEKTLCPDCEKLFKAWLEKKGYLARDCWCRHIEEFKAAHDA